MGKGKHLPLTQKLQLKEMLDADIGKAAIAIKLGVSRATIYNEIKRGMINGEYNPEYSEERYRENLLNKGPSPVLSLNSDLADYISKLILEDHKSPKQIIEELQKDTKFNAAITSANTIYKAIDHGLIPGVSRKDLNSNTTVVYDEQIHIASWVRKALNIKNGDVLRFEIEDNKLIFIKE